MGIGNFTYINFSKSREIENDTIKIYTLLREAMYYAYSSNTDIFVYFNNKLFIQDNDTDKNNGYIQSVKTINNFNFNVAFGLSYIKINNDGFVSTKGNISNKDGAKSQYDCVKFSTNRITIGKYNTNNANCE